MKKYDFIFSIGEACSSTQSLRASNLQLYSYPFDWLYGSTFEGRVEILLSDFNRFLEKNDLVNLNLCNGDTQNLCNIYHNSFNDITFNHDFQYNLPLDKTYEKVREKYKRRITRLYNSIENSQKILIVYLETPNNPEKISDNDILISCLQKIENRYPNKEFNLLYFTNDNDLKNRQYKEEKISDRITKIIGNYKSLEKGVPEYSVDFEFFKKYYLKYSLNTTFQYKIKNAITKFFVNIVPIKSKRRSLRKKYHV